MVGGSVKKRLLNAYIGWAIRWGHLVPLSLMEAMSARVYEWLL